MNFPYGQASLAILVMTVLAGIGLIALDDSHSAAQGKPDLILATFTKEHAAAYRKVLPIFEEKHGVHVQIQVVDPRALQSRLQSAMQVGADVPDMVELQDGFMSFFTRGTLADIQMVDLTERLRLSGLDQRLVSNRFSKWSSRGRIFALPHDVHPTMLAYRTDLIAELGIDATKLTTWDEFTKVGREIAAKYRTADGLPAHYMIDLPIDGGDILPMLALQRGSALFDASGNVTFDSEDYARTIAWYVQQVRGKERIGFPAGWGQNLAKAMYDGVVLFITCPDWRTFQFEMDLPKLKGKVGLIPLPAWEPGGRRTSTWGATGLAFPKRGRNFDLAWELAMFLYYDPQQLGPRFLSTNILPPLKTAWTEPQFAQINDYWKVSLGQSYIPLADEVPPAPSNPYYYDAVSKVNRAYTRASDYFAANGEIGLLDLTRRELKAAADDVRVQIARNPFLRADAASIAERAR